MSDRRSPANIFLILAFVFYGISFLAPFGDGTPGIVLFLVGLNFAWIIPPWLANPLFWIAAWCVKNGKLQTAVVLSAFACLIAVMPLPWFPGWRSEPGLANSGYWLWSGSMSLLLIATLLHWISEPVSPHVRVEPGESVR